MATVLKRMYLAQPGTSSATLYTVPASNKSIIKQIVISNTTSSTATLTLNVVPNGGSATAANQILSSISIYGFTTVTFDLSVVLDTVGDTIRGLQGTASALTVLISGVEIA